MEITSQPMNEENIQDKHVQIILYKRRWIMLALFSLCSFLNSLLFNEMASINDLVAGYYNVAPTTIDWLPNLYCLMMLAVSLPSAYILSHYGLRLSLIVTASLNTAGTCLRFAGVSRNGFPFIFAGALLSAMSVGFVLQAPPAISSVWFGIKETAIATLICIVANNMGTGIGFLQPTYMVHKSKDMQVVGDGLFNMLLSQMIFGVVLLIAVYLWFEDAPPSPPSFARYQLSQEGHEPPTFWLSLKVLFTDINYLMLTQVASLGTAVFVLYAICLNQMVNSFVSETTIGWIVFSMSCIGMLGCFVCGVLLDRYNCHKAVSVCLVLAMLAGWISFVCIMMYDKNQTLLFAASCLIGFAAIPLLGVAQEHAVELTYPVPAGTSSSIMVMFFNGYTFVCIYVVGRYMDAGRLHLFSYICSAILLVALIAACSMRGQSKRKTEDSNVAQTFAP